MSHLHALHTRAAPIHYKARFQDEGLSKADAFGISNKPNHLDHRRDCLRHFAEVFGENVLVSTSLVVGTINR